MANLYRIPQYRTTTLSVPGGIDNSQTTGIILADLPADLDAAVPGILALTWANPVDEDAIEYITYTSINTGTKEVQGVTRGAEGFSARAHDNQATIAWVVSKSHVNNVVDRLEGTDTNLVRDPNGNELFLTTYVSSAVNYVRVKNAATGNGPELQALGDDTNIDFVLQAKGTGAYALKGTATASAEARLYEDTDNGTNYIGLKAPATVGTSKTFVLPDADGSANQVLKTDGSANLGWTSIAADGWTPVTDTFVYVSASSFKIEGVDRTTTYTKGTRIKLTQTSAKYFVVTSSSFSTDTTVNVTAGTDYTVANAAITSPYYSYDMSPQGYPTSFTYAPSPTNWTVGDGTWTRAIFSVVDRRVFVSLKFTFGSTSAMAGSMAISTPITIGQSGASDIDVLGVASIRDTGSAMYDATVYYVSSSAVRLYARGAGSTYVGPIGLSSTVPMTWTTNDQFIAEFSYYL